MKKLLIIILLAIGLQASSQDITTIKSRPKIGLNGGFNLGSDLYSVKGIDARRSPFSWVAAGNLRFKVGIINVPLSFSFRDQQFSYGASFNKFGMSPYYKWAKLHIGHRTMRFSKYSMSGKNFYGLGADLTPGKFRLSAFRGTIRNPLAVRDTLVFGAVLLPTYQRRATGAKVGFGTRINHLDFIFLRIKDDAEGGEVNPGEIDNLSLDLSPVDNLVLGTEWKFRLFKKLVIRGSVNASAFTENTLLTSGSIDDNVDSNFGNLLTVNSSTSASLAGDIGASLTLGRVRLGAEYRRIEPNYRSLGIPFIQSDIQSTMLSTGISLFKQKVNIDARAGVEKNNLRNFDFTGRERLLTSVRASVVPNENWMINANISNYQYETVDGLVEINDTLRYINVNQTSSLNVNYSTKNEGFNYGAFMTVVRQQVRDQSPVLRITDDIKNDNFNFGVKLNWKPINLSIKPAINYSKYTLPDRINKRYGLGVSVSKKIIDEKMDVSFNTRYSTNEVNDKNNGYVWTNRLGLSYKLNDHNSLLLNLGLMDREATIGRTFTEFRSNASYGYRF